MLKTYYQEFLDTKQSKVINYGHSIPKESIHPKLFEWQKDIVAWAVQKGRCAIFLDTGLGKTFIQLEWARLTGVKTLIIAPLSVARQTVREAKKIDLEIQYVRSQEESQGDNKIWITNYEMADKFDYSKFGAVVLDESSILKSIGGATRKTLTELCARIPYRLCCTATPAPNDYIELGNHTEFLGICKMNEMLSMFFINANKEHTLEYEGVIYRRKGTNKAGTEWRLKHHAEQPFFKWLASWAITMVKPSDLGYDDDGFILPPLNITPIFIHTDYKPQDQLFFTELHGIGDRAQVRKKTVLTKLSDCVKIITTDMILKAGDSCHNQTLKNGENTYGNIISSIGMGNSPNKNLNENLLPFPSENEEANKIENGICAIKPKSLRIQKNITKITNNELLPTENNTERTILNSSSLKKSNASTVLIYENTGGCLSPSTVNAPSAELTIPKSSGGLGLTMTTKTGESEDYSAPIAISELATLEIAKNYCKKLLSTCGKLDKVVIWCGLDKEQSLLADVFGNLCVSVHGALSPDEKENRELAWREGDIPVMITKSKIFGFGMNWQCCHNMVFYGLNDSWETYYQCIRREWRYGQTKPVNVYIIMHEAETEIYQNVLRKDAMAKRLRGLLIEHIKDYTKEELGVTEKLTSDYQEKTVKSDGWIAMLGDSCERLGELTENSIDLSVYSPPFADLFTYTASDRDLGNSKDWGEFFNHYQFIISEILRVTKPGRLTCVHTSDIPAMAQKDGYIGVKDFPGEVIRAYEKAGWVFTGRAFVDKNPQAQAIRIKSKALLFVQLRKDSSDSRPALIDQILLFKKPGENAIPVMPVKTGELDNETWIEWAHGIWLGIRETETLQFHTARSNQDDEKHICPLQLGTIERCIKLYSNPGEMVLTPFGGIGSEAYMALKLGRRATLIELKPEYFDVAVKNLKQAENNKLGMMALVSTPEPVKKHVSPFLDIDNTSSYTYSDGTPYP
jgi:DNA modification methylase